jgi:hypothetical protein
MCVRFVIFFCGGAFGNTALYAGEDQSRSELPPKGFPLAGKLSAEQSEDD